MKRTLLPVLAAVAGVCGNAPAAYAQAPAPGPVEIFADVCLNTAADVPKAAAAALRRGWREDAGAQVADVNGLSRYFRSASGTLALELTSYDGSPPPPIPDQGHGTGAAVMKGVLEQEADAKAEKAAARVGRLRPAVGLTETSCAILADATAEAIVQRLPNYLGAPNAPSGQGTTFWIFNHTGDTRRPRPETEASRDRIIQAGYRTGPLHTVSVSQITLEGRQVRVIRYTRYSAVYRPQVANPGSPVTEFRRVCLETGGGIDATRAAALAGGWNIYNPPGIAWSEGVQGYIRAGKQMFLSDRTADGMRVQQCALNFEGRDLEAAVGNIQTWIGREPYPLPVGDRRWIFYQAGVQRPMVAAGEQVTTQMLQDWVNAYGEVRVISLKPWLGRLTYLRYSR